MPAFLPTGEKTITVSSHFKMKGQLPQALAQRGQGAKCISTAPQPLLQERRRWGWSQAGFHTVNYSVANSAPGRGDRRESESEASHSGAAKAGRTRLSWGPPT